jgi:hypothetical protein
MDSSLPLGTSASQRLTKNEKKLFDKLSQKMAQTNVSMKKKTKPRNMQTQTQKVKTNTSGMAMPITTSGPAVSDLFKRNRRSDIGKRIRGLPPPSAAGWAFLKAVFASPDFAGQGKFNGIPDSAAYSTLKYRHAFTSDLYSTLTASALLFKVAPPVAGQDILICQPPVPGVAFYWAQIAPGSPVINTTQFIPVPFNDFAQLFSTPVQTAGTLNALITQCRFAGNSLELICTSNAFTWTGSIIAFKGKTALVDSKAYTPTTGNTLSKQFTGLENFNNAGQTSNLSTPSNLGVYMTSVNSESTFPWSDIDTDLFAVNTSSATGLGVMAGNFPGCGTLETNFVRLTGTWPTGATPTTNFILRAWSTLEYVPVEGTVFSNAATPSAAKDEAALRIYDAVVADLPVACTYFENDSFWKKLLGVVGSVGSALSVIPGWGAIAGGVGSLASTVASSIS